MTEQLDVKASPNAFAGQPRQAPAIVQWLACGLAVLALAIAVVLWLKLSAIQEALARQSQDASALALEARSLAKASQEAVREFSIQQVALEGQVREFGAYRQQFDDLMRNFSRSRDDNVVVDLDAVIRFALLQARLTGSPEPLMAALRNAEQRVNRAQMPRLQPLEQALKTDIEGLQRADLGDTPSLVSKLDEVLKLADGMTSFSAAPRLGPSVQALTPQADPSRAADAWFHRVANAAREQVFKLVRVSRIEAPEAALLAPDQGFIVRENLKLRLLSARLALLARQLETARGDLRVAAELVGRYFDRSQAPAAQIERLLAQVQSALASAEQPRADRTLAALSKLAELGGQAVK